MEPLNNDMDDLFRKAGDLYPLKTTGSDWDGVLTKLRQEGLGEPGSNAVVTSGREHKKRRWLFLLFIPLALGSVVYFSSSKIKTGTSVSFTKNKPFPRNTERDDNSANISSDQDANTNKQRLDGSSSTANSAETENNIHKRENEPGLSRQETSAQTPKSFSRSIFSKKSGLLKNGVAPALSASISSNEKNIPSLASETGDKGFSKADNPVTEAAAFDLSLKQPVIKPVLFSVYYERKMTAVHVPEVGNNSIMDLSAGHLAASPTKFALLNKGFYVGFLAGPDLSTVHLQAIKNIGFSVGVLIGYRFNQRLSLETGLLWDKKYYYSTGNYFDKSKTSIPVSENIKTLNGYCNMFEIPVALRYDFATRKNHGFFAKAGLSSYLMKKEAYTINAEISGTPVSYPYSYNNSTKNIFSILQLSAGYEHAVSAKTRIRIEPYLKIPLQGIGIGSMPISSAGFYFGISHSFR